MPIDTEARIRDRACALWEAAGRPDGHDKEFWSIAERDLANDLDRSAEDAEIDLPPAPAGRPVQ